MYTNTHTPRIKSAVAAKLGGGRGNTTEGIVRVSLATTRKFLTLSLSITYLHALFGSGTSVPDWWIGCFRSIREKDKMMDGFVNSWSISEF